MSHQCGPECRRNQTPGTGEDCPSCGPATPDPLPDYITDGSGKTREVTWHLKEEVIKREDRRMVTEERIVQVLDGWRYRCITLSGRDKRPGWSHWGKVRWEGKDRILAVVTSINDERIVTVYLDNKATESWEKGNLAYFEKRCRDGTYMNFEERK